ncbi:hypothetical protein J132_03407 [Termitomyces sp. J132]|nr:hypothetical protein J132_03407 [Termitomyces sp. J132]
MQVDTIQEDPATMWQKLKEIHPKSAPNTHFNSLSDLLNIRLQDGKSLIDLRTCIKGTMQCIQALCPLAIVGTSRLTSPEYTLQMLNNELVTMAMLCTLPHNDYASFISSILLLNSLTKDNVLEAFQIEETQQSTAKEDAEIATTAVACMISCFICNGLHKIQDCPGLSTACENAKKTNGNKPKKHGNCYGAKADAAKATDTSKVEDGCNGPAVRVEAAICQSTDSPHTPSDVLCNTDSGASTHMTPHYKWFLPDFFKPWRVLIYLANSAVIYSAGKGDVLFRPVERIGMEGLLVMLSSPTSCLYQN